jgi:hypothetical protein
MAAFRLPLTILQGETFSHPLVWKAGVPAVPVDLTGCSARMQVRSVVTSGAVLLELTSANGRIQLGGSSGEIELRLTAAETEALAWRNAVYDLEIVHSDASVRRLLEGSIKVKPEVTRA